MDIPDITPDHNPVSLARDMVDKAPGCIAGFYCLVREDNAMAYDMAGLQRQDILWALERMKILLLRGVE